MKLGLIVEGLPDLKVMEYLARQIRPDIVFESRALGNKPKLLANCGFAANQLLELGCHQVAIVWDLYPATWGVGGHPKQRAGRSRRQPCRKEDSEQILASLQQFNVEPKSVFLLCIDAMLETWLLRDTRALSACLSTRTRKVSVSISGLDREKRPKARMRKLYQQEGVGHRQYSDLSDAIKIVTAMPDLSAIRKDENFRRFESKLTA